MERMSSTPIAELLDRDFAGHELLILFGPIVGPLAFAAREFYEAVL